MARILVGSIPVVGHINPLVPIVRALCERGHEVRWYTGAKYRSKVEAAGARFVGRTHARDYDDAQIEREFPGRANLRGIAQLKFDMKHVFIEPVLIAPTLEGLANEDLLVVVATGGRAPGSLGLRNLPRNARVHTFLSYPELLPKTSVMVTNGGYGGVQMALAHGVPLIVAGTSEDKPEVGTRVACSDAGMNLKTAAPKAEQVRRAVGVLLHQPRYCERARALAAEYARYDAVTLAVETIGAISR